MMDSAYDADDNTTRICTGRDSNRDEGQLACRFTLEKFAAAGCGEDDDFGYSTGQPCVVVYLNRVKKLNSDFFLFHLEKFSSAHGVATDEIPQRFCSG